MLIQSLNGSWELHQAGQDTVIPAVVPGCVHLDLLAAGVIADPFYRDNERRALWVSEVDWHYSRTFAVDSELLSQDRVLLRCEGLDTLATLTLNGQDIATTDNMFRTWEFDVKRSLKQGENRLEVVFQAPLPYVLNKEQTDGRLFAWGVGQYKSNGGGWIRKQPSNFGWDWGPRLTTSGIWRDILLVGLSDARLSDVQFRQHHDPAGFVRLDIQVAVERMSAAAVKFDVQVVFQKQIIAEAQVDVSEAASTIDLDIPDPHLWYPFGMGAQPLYEVTVTLRRTDSTILDEQTKRIGLRTLKIERHEDQWGESFQFVANGIPFFAKGANWIPSDTFVSRLNPDDYRRLLTAAVDANMNMLRVWGGGIYESDSFYEMCDELGLCVWQDFMFACSIYPTRDSSFMTTVKAEAEDAVRRLRHHASLALWCGNNELEQGLVADATTETTMSWADYGLLFDDLLKQVVVELNPDTDYWPASPHTPRGSRSDWRTPAYGDSHVWQVWHELAPFEFYRTANHRFVSEFGFQSFPEPRTVETYTLPGDRNITSFVMEHHQRHPVGNSIIVHYMTDWFRLPTSFDMMLWLSQILQGLGMKYAVEHWRRNMPRTMGALYWQINDCWPVASWSSIDYFGRWKALHYMARQFFAPFLISGVEDADHGTAAIFITSDAGEDKRGQVEWILTDLQGAALTSGTTEVVVSSRCSSGVQTLELAPYVTGDNSRNTLLWLYLQIDGETVSSNLVMFARPKHLDLRAPTFTTGVHQSEDGFVVTCASDVPSLYTWLSLRDGDARFSDNFFHLLPGKPARILIGEVPESMTAAELQERLVIHSLTDTFSS